MPFLTPSGFNSKTPNLKPCKKQSNNPMINVANQHMGSDMKELESRITNKTFQSVSSELPKLLPTASSIMSTHKYSVSGIEVERKRMAINSKKAVWADNVTKLCALWLFSLLSRIHCLYYCLLLFCQWRLHSTYLEVCWCCTTHKSQLPQRLDTVLTFGQYVLTPGQWPRVFCAHVDVGYC